MTERTEPRVINQVSIGKRVRIKYTEQSDTGSTDHVVKSSEAPSSAFQIAVQALLPHGMEVAELPPDWGQADSEARVVTATITHTKDILGAQVTLQRQVAGSNSPVTVVVPHQAEEPYTDSGGDESKCMTAEYADAVRQVEQAALAYLAGERAQQKLPLDE